MNLYRYYFYMYGESVAGVVEANDENEAKEIVYGIYEHCFPKDTAVFYERIKIEKMNIEAKGYYEVYYGSM